MAKIHVLVVEDDTDIQQLVSYNLLRAGMNVSCADSGEEALEKLKSEPVDCVLLDLMLPGISGIDVCSAIRRRESESKDNLAVIMLTAKGEEEDVIAGLEHGADDYIIKPFSPRVLIARVKSVVKRAAANQRQSAFSKNAVIRLDGLTIDKKRHEVGLDGQQIQLTITEFAILSLLAEKPGWVFTRQQIIDSVRGYDFIITPRAIDVQIFGLRKKMGSHGKQIETVRGIGYRYASTPESG